MSIAKLYSSFSTQFLSLPINVLKAFIDYSFVSRNIDSFMLLFCRLSVYYTDIKRNWQLPYDKLIFAVTSTPIFNTLWTILVLWTAKGIGRCFSDFSSNKFNVLTYASFVAIRFCSLSWKSMCFVSCWAWDELPDLGKVLAFMLMWRKVIFIFGLCVLFSFS